MTRDVQRAVLQDLGWRLQHYIVARDGNADAIATTVGLTADELALVLSGHQDLPFSTLCAVLDQLDVDWWHLFGADVCYPSRTHALTLESDAWAAVESGLQTFDLRRDTAHYRAGDDLCLYEKRGTRHTGKVLTRRVSYILYAASVGGPPGYVVMALQDPIAPTSP